MAGNVNYSSGVVVIHQRPAAKHVIEHAENRPLIARNDARGKNYRVVFVYGNVAVAVHSDARKGGHRLRLAAAGENHEPLGIKAADVLRPHDHSVGDMQKVQRVCNLDVVNHAAPDEGDFAINTHGDINHLLDAVNRRREAGQNHAARRRAAQLFDAWHDDALRRRETRALDVGGIAEKSQHAFAAILCKSMQIESRAIDRRLVDLEIPSMNHYADRRSNRQRHAIQSAVRDGNEFNFVGSDLDETAGHDFAQRCGIQQSRFVQALFYQR